MVDNQRHLTRIATLFFGLQRFIFDSDIHLVHIREVHGEPNRLLFTDGDALKCCAADTAVLVILSVLP